VKVSYYKHFRDEPAAQLASIPLQIRSGAMRKRALRENAPFVMAWETSAGWFAVGWATLVQAGDVPGIQVYVRPEFRRRGIGRKLVRRLMDEHKLWNKPVGFWLHSKVVRKFFADAAGINPTKERKT
jgi:GNAT superfamily N-acetyltransferase